MSLLHQHCVKSGFVKKDTSVQQQLFVRWIVVCVWGVGVEGRRGADESLTKPVYVVVVDKPVDVLGT